MALRLLMDSIFKLNVSSSSILYITLKIPLAIMVSNNVLFLFRNRSCGLEKFESQSDFLFLKSI